MENPAPPSRSPAWRFTPWTIRRDTRLRSRCTISVWGIHRISRGSKIDYFSLGDRAAVWGYLDISQPCFHCGSGTVKGKLCIVSGSQIKPEDSEQLWNWDKAPTLCTLSVTFGRCPLLIRVPMLPDCQIIQDSTCRNIVNRKFWNFIHYWYTYVGLRIVTVNRKLIKMLKWAVRTLLYSHSHTCFSVSSIIKNTTNLQNCNLRKNKICKKVRQRWNWNK